MTAQTSKPNERGSTAVASTAWALLAGWVLVRLVTTGGRARQPLARRRSTDAGSESNERGQAKDSHVDPGAALADPAAGDRGRHAESPTEIPVRGWKDILWRVYEEFNQDHVTSVAAGVTFFALLAIFPAIGALVSIYGLFADPATIRDHLNTLSGVLPGGAMEIIGEQVGRIASAGERHAGLCVPVRSRRFAVECECGHEGDLRSPQHRLRGRREAKLHPVERDEPRFHSRRDPVPALRPRAPSSCSRSCSTSSVSAGRRNGSSRSRAGPSCWWASYSLLR